MYTLPLKLGPEALQQMICGPTKRVSTVHIMDEWKFVVLARYERGNTNISIWKCMAEEPDCIRSSDSLNFLCFSICVRRGRKTASLSFVKYLGRFAAWDRDLKPS